MESFPVNSNSQSNQELAAEDVAVGWPWRLLFFSFFIFLLSIFIYFGLNYGYKSYLQGQIDFYNGELAKLSSQVSVEDQERFVNFYSQLFNLQKILADHPFSSNLFRFLEKDTIPPVYFSEVAFKKADGSFTLRGISNNFENLSSQLAIFAKAPEVAKPLLNNVSLQKDGVSFSLSLTMQPDFFKQLTQ